MAQHGALVPKEERNAHVYWSNTSSWLLGTLNNEWRDGEVLARSPAKR